MLTDLIDSLTDRQLAWLLRRLGITSAGLAFLLDSY